MLKTTELEKNLGANVGLEQKFPKPIEIQVKVNKILGF